LRGKNAIFHSKVSKSGAISAKLIFEESAANMVETAYGNIMEMSAEHFGERPNVINPKGQPMAAFRSPRRGVRFTRLFLVVSNTTDRSLYEASGLLSTHLASP